MKITKRQLRRIIREEKNRLLNEQIPPDDPYASVGGPDPSNSSDPRLAHELIKAINRGRVFGDVGDAPGEVYIMIGGARNPDLDNGITIKVLRSGR